MLEGRRSCLIGSDAMDVDRPETRRHYVGQTGQQRPSSIADVFPELGLRAVLFDHSRKRGIYVQ